MSVNELVTLTDVDLDRVTGGADEGVCTPDNPSGQSQPTQFFENSHAGPSLNEQVIKNTDRAMAPWKTFNDLFGGFAGARPTGPTPQRPTYR
jgi:hypothetical protein